MQSKFLAVGAVVPWAEPQAGAVATQSYANPRYGPDGLALLRQGLSAADVGPFQAQAPVKPVQLGVLAPDRCS